MKWINNFLYKFRWMKVYNSPFKFIIPKLYIGRKAIGLPYFFPRKWVKDKDKPGYLKAIPRKIGFDFVGLGWKSKWTAIDYRHEWNPTWSFVFFNFQIALIFQPKHDSHYWECWLYYSRNTDKKKSSKERIKDAKKDSPCVWISYEGDKEVEINYWNYILKKKYE